MMMEKHKCKLCFKNFSNGRALGGHMRSHMMNLPVPPKPNEAPPPPPPPPTIQLSFEAESASSPSPSSFDQEEDKGLSYGLRENPKRNFRFADPEFSFPAAVDTGSVILQDRESETESSRNPTRKRSKRARKLSFFDHQTTKRTKLCKPIIKNESASSVSDTTTEEDVAFCLMMLSRDKWKRQQHCEEEQEQEKEQEDDAEDQEDQEEEEEEDEDSDESEEELKTTTRVRGRYKCDTCNKVFRSYQALGGHRASHKKIKVVDHEPQLVGHENNNGAIMVVEKKIHECPVCFRVFASGQALGGHKRTHVTGSATVTNPVRSSIKFGDSLIDLNLPAPMDDDDVSQIDDSAVSDAEFIKPH
ncbi:zinc finger protein ZAT9-like [Gastrolobium bilobum]|uniref:zinc finger protein ZAT9-like n=1 Tax=Gastrolobium bilobum TaxID=150636 RepID=UPI002AB17BE8|nr:zinc finger protein ZAT9-like [Gastrolobium bilobum]